MKHISNILSNKRLMKYFFMAVIIVGIELTTFQLIYLMTHNSYLATVGSFVLAVLLNWIAGRVFVFGVSRHHALREFTMVLIASIIGLLIQLAVVYISVTILALYPLIGKFFSILFSFFWNYWFRSAIIYKEQ
jgi:putative flippase GtrA